MPADDPRPAKRQNRGDVAVDGNLAPSSLSSSHTAPLTTPSVFPPASEAFMKFPSRRSVVHSTEGIVACTQPLAAKCGLRVLQAGGNCADRVTVTDTSNFFTAAGLNMTEPCSTGIGGDMFCLYYDAQTKKISAMNGSGRSGAKCTLETVRKSLGLPADGTSGNIPMDSVHAVSVPGAPAGWVDTVERFGSGKLSMEQILAPAIELGEKGFPVSEGVAFFWGRAEAQIRGASPNGSEMLKEDPSAPSGVRAPRAGEIMKNPTLAKTFRALATEGKKGFYTGRIAEELVKVVQDLGGHLELDDLAHHMDAGSESVDPISLKFRGQNVASRLKDHVLSNGASANTDDLDYGLELWEHPPNGQGIVALMALGILQELEKAGQIPTWGPDDFNTAPYLHAIIESLRIAFADAAWFVTDPNVEDVPTPSMISPAYLASRASLFSPASASAPLTHGSPALQSSDTVYFAVSDAQGNAISFINSNYGGFGTCIIPEGCGFTLQNRAANFSLDARHPNALAPRKRPYHTIIPAAVTNLHDGSLHSVFGVMGGFMQPQGHVQVLLGQVVGGLSPQQALDAPRVCIGSGTMEDGMPADRAVCVEEGMPEATVQGLRDLGHEVKVLSGMARAKFGRGQIIRWSVDPVEGTGVWSAGSDMRGDGGAYPLGPIRGGQDSLLLEHLCERPVLVHRDKDVAAADELLLELLVLQHVERGELAGVHALQPEDLDAGAREAALGHLGGALHEEHDGGGADGLLDGLLGVVGEQALLEAREERRGPERLRPHHGPGGLPEGLRGGFGQSCHDQMGERGRTMLQAISHEHDDHHVRSHVNSLPALTAALHDGKKHLLLAASGSVATIKIPNIIQALSPHPNLSIRVLFTPAATRFLAGQSPEQPTVSSLLSLPSVDAVYTDADEWRRPWRRGDAILHIELRRWADLLVIAPLSANTLAGICNGFADGLLTSVVRAWDCWGQLDAVAGAGAGANGDGEGGARRRKKKRILVAPAMNTAMWRHPITAKQLRELEEVYGSSAGWFEVLRPQQKALACGDVGDGAMMEWNQIVKVIEERLGLGTGS
ncbi:gamma-glutamyltranspeptidase-domain-containing protein [Xylariaceae sp. FL0016]|nr:gamma-glutamyltranspeptidase-domain-containing protein [Xylariaceae sp. FL0016]